MQDKLKDKRWLEQQVGLLPVRLIAQGLGLPYSRVYKSIKDLGIVVPKRQGYIYTEESRRKKSLAQKAAYKRKFPQGRFGELHPRWNGGRRLVNGYIAIYKPGHPRATNGNRVFEHILVAEQSLGRPLSRDEVVHHVNGDKQDNRPENLEVVLRKEHAHKHHISGERIQELHQRIAYLEGLLIANGIAFD